VESFKKIKWKNIEKFRLSYWELSQVACPWLWVLSQNIVGKYLVEVSFFGRGERTGVRERSKASNERDGIPIFPPPRSV